MKNIEILINLEIPRYTKKFNNKEYNDLIMICSGPKLFTKIIKKYDKGIIILQEDYFCCGSGQTVPQTKNSYVKHHFTGSWR